MAIGVRIYNPSTGRIQIDETYQNLSLVSKATITVTPGQGSATTQPNGIHDLTLDAPWVTPIMAIGESSAFIIPGREFVSGTNRTWRLSFDISGQPVTFTYYIFSPVPVAGTGPGFVIRNPGNGGINFDSRYKYMKVHSIITGIPRDAQQSAPNPPGSWTLPSGKTYAQITSPQSTGTPGIFAPFISAAKLNGNVVSSKYIFNNTNVPYAQTHTGRITILDVSYY